jgi:uncharacterized repeat protein (TIGR02543 family)
MKTKTLVLASVAALLTLSGASGQGLMLANPHWNITLTDYGYSDFLFDNTPGFEGREYLSGEWGAAVGYQVSGGPSVASEWLQPLFLYPDWPTNSNFTVVSPLTDAGLNADGLPIAQSVIKNAHLQITQRFEMLDTVTGTPMGTNPASAGGSGAFHHSNRYVMKHTYTVKNIALAPISNLRLFQLLHGMNSQRGLHDNRIYAGPPLSNFRYDTTLAGVDQWAVGAGAGLEDFITFHATSSPTAHEIGYYGIEGNGLDNHGMGKPSVGTHLSIEADALNGTDSFSPPTRWVAGAQRWTLGNLAVDQSVSFDVLLSILTGTRVPAGPGSTGSCDGGSSVPGGIDYEFESVETEGSCFSDFSRADQDELAVRVAQGEFSEINFATPSQPAQIWNVEFSGTYAGLVTVKFGYDPSLLPAGFDEDGLAIYHSTGGGWVKLSGGTVNPLTHSISVSTTELGAFALGVDAAVNFTISATAAPLSGSGSITGDGSYAQGSSVTLVASANPGFAFSNWTEDSVVVSSSPTFTFTANADRTLVANFIDAGGGFVISTSSTPTAGGSTSGDGAYADGASATVSASPNPGYKFSKWLINGVVVSTARNYTFTVTENQTLLAKFKPVYYVTATAEPLDGGNPEADPFYEVGELAKLKSKPEPGWSLVSWTQNGVVVSTDEDFSFNVSGNRDLVANYALGDRIDLLADPKTAGNVSGAGVFESGNSVSVSAEARPGYIFIGWTEKDAFENDVFVSNDADYTFTAGGVPRSLTARFIALPKLAIAPAATPGQLDFIWPDAPGWLLEETGDLATWRTSTRDITTANGQRSVTVDPSEGKVFFRLKHP